MSKPEIIYLQVGEQDDLDSVDWSEATWCVDKVFSTDIEYRRPDKMQQEIRDHMGTINQLEYQLATIERETADRMDKIHPDIKKWHETHGVDLFIGLKVKVLPTAQYYEACYDAYNVYTVVQLNIDSGGVNIGLNDGHNDKFLCETDGYYIDDLTPFKHFKLT